MTTSSTGHLCLVEWRKGMAVTMEDFKDFKIPKCNFCGKEQAPHQRMFAGNDAYICDDCIMACYEALTEVLEAQRENAAEAPLRKKSVKKY